jgi:hypothetical protein
MCVPLRLFRDGDTILKNTLRVFRFSQEGISPGWLRPPGLGPAAVLLFFPVKEK